MNFLSIVQQTKYYWNNFSIVIEGLNTLLFSFCNFWKNIVKDFISGSSDLIFHIIQNLHLISSPLKAFVFVFIPTFKQLFSFLFYFYFFSKLIKLDLFHTFVSNDTKQIYILYSNSIDSFIFNLYAELKIFVSFCLEYKSLKEDNLKINLKLSDLESDLASFNQQTFNDNLKIKKLELELESKNHELLFFKAHNNSMESLSKNISERSNVLTSSSYSEKFLQFMRVSEVFSLGLLIFKSMNQPSFSYDESDRKIIKSIFAAINGIYRKTAHDNTFSVATDLSKELEDN